MFIQVERISSVIWSLIKVCLFFGFVLLSERTAFYFFLGGVLFYQISNK